MRCFHIVLGVLLTANSSFMVARAELSHRVLILDGGSAGRSAFFSRLQILEVETGRLLAQADVGFHPDIVVSPKGDRLAVLSEDSDASRLVPQSRLTILETEGLRRLQSVLLPFRRTPHTSWSERPLLQFSPDGTEVIVQRMQSELTDEKPRANTFDSTILQCVKLGESFRDDIVLSRNAVTIPRCRTVGFLRVSDWPRVTIWNSNLGTVEVVDFDKGQVTFKLSMDNERFLAGKPDLDALSKANIGELTVRFSTPRGAAISVDSRYALYLPKDLSGDRSDHIKKVDLLEEHPKIVLRSPTFQTKLRALQAASSPASDSLFVVKNALKGSAQSPSNVIQRYKLSTLEGPQDFEVPVENCDRVEASVDGTHLYVLDRKSKRVVVLTAPDGVVLKMLETLAIQPISIIALPAGIGNG